MCEYKTYESIIKSIKGKTIAIVYIFEKEDAPGFDHFLVWKNEIISGWLNAVYELECLPFIIDVRTFIQKASNNSLPLIDYVINLNSGCYKLSTMSLIPSLCSFMDIPCIPCDAVAILTSENKRISNLIARGMDLCIPENLKVSSLDGVFRPINLGNSIGLKRGHSDSFVIDGVYQKFIPGYDVTIPIAFNPCTNNLDLLPPILYLPKSLDPNWIYDEDEKINDNGFTAMPFLNIEESAKHELVNFSQVFPIQSFGRIDARIQCNEELLSEKIVEKPFSLNNLFFIEINSMPTIEQGDAFDLSFNAVMRNTQHSFHNCCDGYKKLINNPTINGFLLSCSIASFTTSKY